MDIAVRRIAPNPAIAGDMPKVLLEFDGLGYIFEIASADLLLKNVGQAVEAIKREYAPLFSNLAKDGTHGSG